MKKLERKVKKYLGERGWDRLRPGDIAKSISIEAAELLELFQWTNPELDDVRRDTEMCTLVKKELADVFIYCFEMAVLLNLDMEKIIRAKLTSVEKKYPAKLMKGREQNPEKGLDLYYQIKRAHRRKEK